MKIILVITLTLSLGLSSFSQEVYTGKKGLRFMPGHLHVVISVDSNELHYQLFNHWYALSYLQYRDIRVPMSEIGQYGRQNDTLTIILKDNKIKLIDKRNKLKTEVRHKKLCESIENMRKISYANSIANEHKDIMHYDLYEIDDLSLNEELFNELVDKNLNNEIKKRHASIK